MKDSDFIIIGDTKEFKDCLVYVCGKEDGGGIIVTKGDKQ